MFSRKKHKRASCANSDFDVKESSVKRSDAQLKCKKSGKTKAKASRIFSAIASHSFDAALALSDSLGPLKAPVSGVGHAKDIWQTVMKTTKDARVLRSELESFRTQVQAVVPNPEESESAKKALTYVVDTLARLDKELNEIETSIDQLLGERVRSRILHWKESDHQLKVAQAKFQSSKDNFTARISRIKLEGED